jgi:adenylate cyclase
LGDHLPPESVITFDRNAQYGTAILVSEAVRKRVEHRFRFKAIASVIAKGMTTQTRVYELVEAIA